METIIASTFAALTHHIWQAAGIALFVVCFSLIQLWRREISKL
jgi:hypothetical protein